MQIESLLKKIIDLEKTVRDHINTHCYQVELLKDSGNWNQICSSLDMIGDSIYAIRSFQELAFPEDSGLKYIYTYGLLQALFLQQDALRHLSEAFNLPYTPSQVLLDIRGIRNASIGHPTKQNQKGQRFYNYISRISMSKNGFDLLRHTENRSFDMVNVKIEKMIKDQLTEIVVGYKHIAEKLEEADKMHKDKFKETPLQDIFHSAMGYFFEKIGQGIFSQSSGDREFGHAHVRLVKETYEKFESALRERNELDKYTEFDLREYFHALKRLDSYLAGCAVEMEEMDARIYNSYILNKHSRFVQIAKEIDEQYKE
jgi:hypothetical protein